MVTGERNPSRLWAPIRWKHAHWAGVALFYAAFAIIQTWPLLPNINNSIDEHSAWPYDSWTFLWNFWWVKHAIIDLHTNPYHTDLVYFPNGSDLYLHTLALMNGVLNIPLQVVTANEILAWNVQALASFVASGLAMYAVSYRVNHNRWGSLLSGYVFAFMPFVFTKLVGIQAHLFTVWPIPLFLLFLLRLQESGRLREAVGAGICWAFIAYNALEYGAWTGMLFALFAVYWSITYLRDRDRDRLIALWRGGVVVAIVFFALTLPMLVPTVRAIYREDDSLSGQDEYFSADLLGFVTPSPLWGPGTSPVLPRPDRSPIGGWENTVFMGITPLLLASVALLRVPKEPRRLLFWLGVFLIFGTLALGPYLYIDDSKDISILGVSFSVPLPYQLYDKLPAVGVGRVPARMIVFAFLGIAILAGAGLTSLLSRLRGGHGRLVPAAALVVLALVVVEFWNPPMEVTQIREPAVFGQIRDDPGDFVVLDVPWGRLTGRTGVGFQSGGAMSMFYQRLHEKAAFGGYLSRAAQSDFDPGPLGQEPGIGYLSCSECPAPQPLDLDRAAVRDAFARYRVRYAVVHRLDPNGFVNAIPEANLQAMDEYLRDIVGLIPVYSDASIAVYLNESVH